ncbi:PPE domain-containing protein [Saccharopolyspora sp. NPDC050389]|uniref:PPE domain-containing protein n=1 Tax=Saccharopolyspora sp. NPDC050389 TaxID=3155516 RepID=UPI0033C65355
MWPFSQPKKIAGQAQAAFDHPKIHRELNGGMGVTSLSIAAGNLSGQFTTRLRRVDELVQGAINRCHRSWSGNASEAMTQESSPFRDVVQQSEELSAALAKGVEGQGEHFSRTKNSMPAPHNVPPLDLGFSDLAPTNLGAKLAGQQIHEAARNEAEQKAREDYAAYRTSSSSTVQSLQPYPPVPSSVADVGVADTQRPNSVDPSTGYYGVGSTATSSSVRTPVYDGSGDTTAGGEGGWSQSDETRTPAESGSAWVSPNNPSPVDPPAGTGVGGGPAGSGTGVGIGIVPRVSGSPGTGTGRGVGGLGGRSGPGVGGRGVLGPGSSSGVGSSGRAGVSGSANARGGAAGGGIAGAGQRGQNAEDEEHERKYIKDTDEHFEFDPEVDPDTGQVIAPPVIDGFNSSQQDEH